MAPTNLKLVKPPLALTKVHIGILAYLRDLGFERAALFDENAVNDLFRARPRLVQLVRGHEEPTIDITSEGLKRLAELPS